MKTNEKVDEALILPNPEDELMVKITGIRDANLARKEAKKKEEKEWRIEKKLKHFRESFGPDFRKLSFSFFMVDRDNLSYLEEKEKNILARKIAEKARPWALVQKSLFGIYSLVVPFSVLASIKMWICLYFFSAFLGSFAIAGIIAIWVFFLRPILKTLTSWRYLCAYKKLKKDQDGKDLPKSDFSTIIDRY